MTKDNTHARTEVTICGHCDFWLQRDYWKSERDDEDVHQVTSACPVKTRVSAIRKDRYKNYCKAFTKMVYEKLEKEMNDIGLSTNDWR